MLPSAGGEASRKGDQGVDTRSPSIGEAELLSGDDLESEFRDAGGEAELPLLHARRPGGRPASTEPFRHARHAEYRAREAARKRRSEGAAASARPATAMNPDAGEMPGVGPDEALCCAGWFCRSPSRTGPSRASKGVSSRPTAASFGMPGTSSLQLAESHLTRTLFRQILRRIERLAWHPT